VELTLDISRHPPVEAEEEIFNLPERIATAQGKRFVVVRDEFREILKFDDVFFGRWVERFTG